MDGRRGVDEVFDGLEVVRAEDLGILEIGDKEGIRRRSGLLQRRERGEVY